MACSTLLGALLSLLGGASDPPLPPPPPPTTPIVVRPAPSPCWRVASAPGWEPLRSSCCRPWWTPSMPPPSCRTKLLAAGLSAAVVAYGAIAWGYGTSHFHATDEGWFGADTKYGGADKAGHVLAAHILTTGVALLHRHWGYDRRQSATIGAATAFGVMTVVEIADAFAEEHGFCWEDLACDAVGCAFGYFHALSPAFARAVDLRWEWWPSSTPVQNERFDPTTGYNSSTYLLAVNVGALAPRSPLPLDLLDLQVGYEVRGLGGGQADHDRRIVYGVGLNLANLLRRFGAYRLATLFDVYQPPGISLRFTASLDH